MVQIHLFNTYADLFSSMEQQLHKGKFPLILFKNITKKRDVREWIFHTTQATFVTKLRIDIVQDLKKLTSSTTVVCIHIHLQQQFAQKKMPSTALCSFFVVHIYIILFNILTIMFMCVGWGCSGCRKCLLDLLWACMCQLQFSYLCLYVHKWQHNWLSMMWCKIPLHI